MVRRIWTSLQSTRFVSALMLALFASCCGLRTRSHDRPDDRTPLIPHADDTPTRVPPPPPPACSPTASPQPRLVDHQKLKDRLGSVVRSKEGKMVNVNAHFPFGLHPDHASSASSRNVSGGTLPSSRAASPSPHRALHKSPSNASVRPDAEDLVHYLPLAVNPAPPILNVRLVKSARSMHSTRGRPQRDPNSRTPALDPQLPPDEQHTPRPRPPSPLFQQSSHLSATPPYPEDFSIHDAGAVARSWGD